ncbi:hypothetical protein [Amycolatopsis sp.]|uniref:hypothetical protein n=1 Tax=Amycolatopsis sp. TaxID=37632 RepID=UPI002C215300|nr:hypothetical protein [Amycolatopsis sp.]HVV14377.1 hypothetical protein [Amycolatopsis sp.]
MTVSTPRGKSDGTAFSRGQSYAVRGGCLWQMGGNVTAPGSCWRPPKCATAVVPLDGFHRLASDILTTIADRRFSRRTKAAGGESSAEHHEIVDRDRGNIRRGIPTTATGVMKLSGPEIICEGEGVQSGRSSGPNGEDRDGGDQRSLCPSWLRSAR